MSQLYRGRLFIKRDQGLTFVKTKKCYENWLAFIFMCTSDSVQEFNLTVDFLSHSSNEVESILLGKVVECIGLFITSI